MNLINDLQKIHQDQMDDIARIKIENDSHISRLKEDIDAHKIRYSRLEREVIILITNLNRTNREMI